MTHAPHIILFGATGDLAKRKLFSALFRIFSDSDGECRPTILAVGRKPMSSEDFRDYVRTDVYFPSDASQNLDGFLSNIAYATIDMLDPSTYSVLADDARAYPENRIYYLSTPPELFRPILSGLYAHELQVGGRIAFEKPFGTNLENARELNAAALSVFPEHDIYRIDHYVGKAAVNELLEFRFANAFFEPLWNRNHIESIHIRALESLGIEGRGGYYDTSGAIRDMIQNHLFQILALVAMEPPLSFEAEAIRDAKLDVIQSIRLPTALDQSISIGQYEGYLAERWVAPDSRTETYISLPIEIANSRWRGVPITLETGKALREKRTDITIRFRPLSEAVTYPGKTVSNEIVFTIAPEESIRIECSTGPLVFAKPQASPEAYERIFSDLIHEERSLFTRADMIETSWKKVDRLLQCQENCPILQTYQTGSDGPKTSGN